MTADSKLWQDEVGDMRAEAHWHAETGDIEVVVTQSGARRLRERFVPVYQPIFGIDVGDLATARVIAEKLAQRLERGEGSPVES